MKTTRFEAARDLPAGMLVILVVACGLAGEAGRALLRYERQAILESGQWWRLATGHFVHLGWPHLWLNLAGCLLVWLLFRKDFTLAQWFLVLVLAVVAIDAGFLLMRPELAWYVGLSGVLHGLFAAGMLRWLQTGSAESWIMLVIFGAKLTWEQFAGPLPMTSESAGGPVIVDAHLFGAVGGALAALSVIAVERVRGVRIMRS